MAGDYNLSGTGLPGTLEGTLIFVYGGVAAQYILGVVPSRCLVTQTCLANAFFVSYSCCR